MGRLAIIVTTLVGGLGLGLSLGYFLLVIAAFTPKGGAISTFLIGASDAAPGFGFLLVLVPYALLVLHLFLRVRVAPFLLRRGEVETARAFATGRLKVNLMRSARESVANRAVLVRIALRERDYGAAVEMTKDARLPRRVGRELVDFRRWEIETALRRDNLVDARAIIAATWPFAVKGAAAAAFCACAGEVAVRNGSQTDWDDWRQRSEFAHPECERLLITQAIAGAKFGVSAEDALALAAQLDQPLQWLQDVPGAGAEVRAIRAKLLTVGGRRDEAKSALEEHPEAADSRSEFVVAQTLDELGVISD